MNEAQKEAYRTALLSKLIPALSARESWKIDFSPSSVDGVVTDVTLTCIGRRKTTELTFTPWECLEMLRVLRENEAFLLRLESLEESTE